MRYIKLEIEDTQCSYIKCEIGLSSMKMLIKLQCVQPVICTQLAQSWVYLQAACSHKISRQVGQPSFLYKHNNNFQANKAWAKSDRYKADQLG